jgi:hypothetical protein
MFRRVRILLSLVTVLLAAVVVTDSPAVAASAGSASVQYGDWIAAGGDDGGRQGNPYEATLNASNLSRLAPAWSIPGHLNTDYPFLSVAGLIVFNASFAGTDGLEAVSSTTGAVVWKHPNVGGALAADGSTIFTGATGVVGGRSVLGIAALDMATGATRWFTAEPDGRAYYVWPRMATGAGMVFIDFSAGTNDYIAAFSEATGALKWFTTPAYFGGVTFADGQVLVAMAGSGGTRSLDPLTGRLAWAGFEPQQWAPTVIDGVAISWSSQDSHVSAKPIAQCAGKAVCPSAWTITLPSTAGGVAGANGVLLVDVQSHGSSAAYLQAVDLHTGRLLWTASNPVGGGGTLSTAGSLVYSSPAGYSGGNTVLTAWSLDGCGVSHCTRPVWSYTFPDAAGDISSAVEVAHGHLMVELQRGGFQSFSLGTNNPAFQGVLGSSSGIATASPTAGRIDLFAVNMQGQLVHRVDQLGGAWSAWTTLGGADLTGTPVAVSDGSSALDVFVRTTAGSLQHISYRGTWSGFDTVASNVRYQPAAVSAAAGRIDLFWLVETSGSMTLHQRTYDGSWKAPVTFGHEPYASLSAASTGPGVIELFAVSAQGKLIRARFANGAWGAWSAVATASRPYLLADGDLSAATVSASAGKVEVFYPQDASTVVHVSYDESSGLATEPENQTVPMQMGLGAASALAGRIDLFAVGTDFAVQQATFQHGVYGPFSQPAEIGAATCSAGVTPQRIAIASTVTSVTTKVASDCRDYQATVVFAGPVGIRGPVHYGSLGQGSLSGQSAGMTFDARTDHVGSYTATLDNGYAAGGAEPLDWIRTTTTIKYVSYAYIATSRSGSAVYVNGLIKNYAGGSRPGVVRGAGRVVYLQRYLPSGWQTMLSRTADSAGQLAVGFIATAERQYRLVVAETGAAWSGTSVASIR